MKLEVSVAFLAFSLCVPSIACAAPGHYSDVPPVDRMQNTEVLAQDEGGEGDCEGYVCNTDQQAPGDAAAEARRIEERGTSDAPAEPEQSPTVPTVAEPNIPAPTVPTVAEPNIRVPTVPTVAEPNIRVPTVPTVAEPNIPVPTVPTVTPPTIRAPTVPTP
jgi:hypothetical protein